MSNFLAHNWLLNRRHVLRGLGVSLALPLLDCMRPLPAAETVSKPRRSVFIYLPNGVNTLDYQITDAGVQSDTFNIAQFSYLLDRLSEVQDASGPLIDTTMALYGSGMAYGHGHGNANLPIILAGGSKLGLNHGRHLDFNAAADSSVYAYDLAHPNQHYAICHQPVDKQAHLSNLLLTMAQKMGVETDKFADSNAAISI